MPILDVQRIARLHIAMLNALSSEPDANSHEMLSALAATLGRFALTVAERSGEDPDAFVQGFADGVKGAIHGLDEPNRERDPEVLA
jgi:hypothetical protein